MTISKGKDDVTYVINCTYIYIYRYMLYTINNTANFKLCRNGHVHVLMIFNILNQMNANIICIIKLFVI